MTTTAPAQKKPTAKEQIAALNKLCGTAVTNGIAALRKVDADAAQEMDAIRRDATSRPAMVIVGETKRGKSSLTNALIGVPNLSPVDAAVATSSYLEFEHGAEHTVQAYVPGNEVPVRLNPSDIRDWGTTLGQLPGGMRPPRRLRIQHSAPLLQYMSLIDTPGVGGLDAMHAEVALDAVARATALLFVVDSSSPFSRPELDFLIEASKRVNFVMFAQTKIDAYPGWERIRDDNIALLQTHAPRFATAPFFPVSSRLAEMALTMPVDAAKTLITESRIAALQHALINLGTKGTVLQHANVLRSLRSEFIRLDLGVAEQLKTLDPDPAVTEKLKEDKKRVTSLKRSQNKQSNMALRTEIQRARVEATSRLRTYVQKLQEELLNKVEKSNRGEIKRMPEEVDRALHALSVRLSQELDYRFKVLADRVLAQMFPPHELAQVIGRINAQLRMQSGSKPRREASGDNAMLIMSSAGSAMMIGRVATMGVGAAGIAATGVASVALTASGVGLGLAAAAFVMYRRKVSQDRQQAGRWVREVLQETRASLQDEIQYRFTEIEYVFNMALDDALERRGQQLDKQIAAAEKNLKQDQATRAKKKEGLTKRREAYKTKVKQLDEVLAKTRLVLPKAPAEPKG
ncbi:dynamin family protein [Stackebrandtia albiflava]|uniref:Dynamin family protein n=1 Tax=Stackebrandtia albiflava TaxID=406432 RepID=A0A562VDA4_9ACTN|nr:dynamin family protein [Stackebrandtia albiflava]TWJ15866.1 dynamin family protein [Stackebrandtia albiflava]